MRQTGWHVVLCEISLLQEIMLSHIHPCRHSYARQGELTVITYRTRKCKIPTSHRGDLGHIFAHV